MAQFIPPPPNAKISADMFGAFPGHNPSPTSSGFPGPGPGGTPWPNASAPLPWGPVSAPAGQSTFGLSHHPPSPHGWPSANAGNPWVNPSPSWGGAMGMPTPSTPFGHHTPHNANFPSTFPGMPESPPESVDDQFEFAGTDQPITSGGFGLGAANQANYGAFPTTDQGFGLPPPGHGRSYGTADGMDPLMAHVHSSRKRSKSLSGSGPTRKRASSKPRSYDMEGLTRSMSYGRADDNFGMGLKGQWNALDGFEQEKIDAHHLAPRPRDWRYDYTPKNSLFSPFSKLNGMGRAYSDVREIHDNEPRDLHYLLRYNSGNPPIDYDLRFDPFGREGVEFPILRRPHNTMDLSQFATSPPVLFMRLFHKEFPWYIDIKPSSPSGVTILDVVSQIHAQLFTMISPNHFYNELLSETDRANLTSTFMNRCKNRQSQIQKGVMRVDYLFKKVVFQGLVRKNGMYELKVSAGA